GRGGGKRRAAAGSGVEDDGAAGEHGDPRHPRPVVGDGERLADEESVVVARRENADLAAGGDIRGGLEERCARRGGVAAGRAVASVDGDPDLDGLRLGGRPLEGPTHPWAERPGRPNPTRS